MRATDTPGWMGERELDWLREKAYFRLCIVEMGSFVGRSTRALAEGNAHRGNVTAWDDFQHHAENPGFEGEDLLELFRQNTSDLSNVMVWKGGHDGPPPVLDGPIDMVFIDGAHDYESVKRDIKWALANVESGGLVCGHDYCEGWPGVVRAVDELVPGCELIEGTSIWAVTITKAENNA